MGRKIRRVPPHWEHPKDKNGNYIPLHDQSFDEAEELTWWQVYGTVSEGTPDTPAFATSAELIYYLFTYGDYPSREAATAFVEALEGE